jgi:predicted nucleotide-binding protein
MKYVIWEDGSIARYMEGDEFLTGVVSSNTLPQAKKLALQKLEKQYKEAKQAILNLTPKEIV